MDLRERKWKKANFDESFCFKHRNAIEEFNSRNGWIYMYVCENEYSDYCTANFFFQIYIIVKVEKNIYVHVLNIFYILRY